MVRALAHPWAEAVYAVNAAFGTTVEVDARVRDGGAEVHIDVIDPYGDVLPDDGGSGHDGHGVGDGPGDHGDAGDDAPAGEGETPTAG